jgi:hypothetical protein
VIELLLLDLDIPMRPSRILCQLCNRLAQDCSSPCYTKWLMLFHMLTHVALHPYLILSNQTCDNTSPIHNTLPTGVGKMLSDDGKAPMTPRQQVVLVNKPRVPPRLDYEPIESDGPKSLQAQVE